ncbi:hypothetical protein JD276_06085 [Leucobacter sp. CSA1]|uniref:DUF5709 domain-containing protein n=1 Tax=Leucobacter chromiisoli TaxID=2796471 RepID=A0A934Q856_9MICO|nr:hypothetical protein [Leucobacter chromiisoli]MBK0418602.1 hypothetical protein [Leucobacter chromiisoli]
MSRMWEENEELGADDELAVTEHRDDAGPEPDPEELREETTEEDGRHVLDEFGEDVSSSPAQRGHDVEDEG